MKLPSLSVKFWRAGYRAQQGTWWLLFATLLGCCGMLLYIILSPFMEHRHSIYYNLACLNTDIRLSGAGQTQEELAQVFDLLADSACVDYYILESGLDEEAAGALTSMSTVVPTRQSLYAVQPSEYLCDSEHGEPLDGYTYINTQYDLAAVLNVSIGDAFIIGDQSLIYTVNFWGGNLFDMLVSNHDFDEYGHAVRRIIYGISPLASRASVDRLNDQLAELLPRARFTVTMDKTLQVNRWNTLRFEGRYYIGLSLVCLLTYFLLFRYLLDRRLRDLTVARLMGCRRGQLLAMLTGEAVLNALAAFLLEMVAFSLYRLLFAKELPRILLLLWGDSLPVLLAMVLLSAAIGLFAGWRWVRRAPVAMEREAMG